MKKIIFVVCCLLVAYLRPAAQNTIGLPDVINYSKESYGAGLQNWDIQQDENGIIYVANNEGLLSFDGRYWNVYPLPNRTIVRSVATAPANRIYAGGQDELGYFAPAANGRLQYYSLTPLLPEKDRSFGDVWDIVIYKGDVFFRTTSRIFKYTHNTIAVYRPLTEWAFMGVCHDRLYAQDFSSGLMSYDGSVWTPLPVANALPSYDPVTALLPQGKDTVLITTLKHGLYSLYAGSITSTPSVNNALFESKRIYAATTINPQRVALGTTTGGVFITDMKGQLVQSFSKAEKLQNNNVLSMFLDRQGNLWLGLDNGIDFIAYNSAIKQVSPQGQDGAGYAAMIYHNELYVGTSNGLYSVGLQPEEDLSFSKGVFAPVANTTGQVWNLAMINDRLLLGHHDGAFSIDAHTAKPLLQGKGVWNFVPLSATFPAARLVAGGYFGLTYLNYVNGQFAAAESIPGFSESARFVVMDQEDRIWVSHPYRGVYRLVQRDDGQYDTKLYTDQHGLPSALNNHVYKVRSEVVIGTEKGVYVYNAAKDRFEPASFYKDLLGNMGIRYLKEDRAGNIWFVHDKSLGVVDMSGAKPTVIYLPELNKKMLSGFELVYPYNDHNIFVSGEKGLFLINYDKYKKSIPALQVQVRTVRITRNTDSLLYGGYMAPGATSTTGPEIAHNWKTIRFEFSASLFGYQQNLEYSYRLKGFDNNWSAWTARTEKEYTNLPAGRYVFEVKARNNLGNESAAAVYSFRVLPPWYQTWWAYCMYLLALAAVVYVIYKRQRQKFRLQQARHEQEQKRLSYIHELEMGKTENELVALRNEKLEADIGFKNSELAASAMHLVKKGELLSKIRGELTQVLKGMENPQAIAEMKRLIRALDEDDNIDREWENFARHFDKVHHDFFATLKEKHPNLTGNELKLCAHLRMNLSSKEIAQLMNISVRGVEISRYRLRKKLGIASDVSLFDYLMG